MTNSYCRSCGETKPIVERYQKWGFRIAECSECSLGFVCDSSTFEPQSYYTRDYFEGGHTDGYSSYSRSKGVLEREFSRTLSYLSKFISGHSSLLEIGCAYGFFLQEAAKRFDCVGIDISEHAVLKCRKKNLTAYCGTIGSVKLDQEFDIVAMFDCIEHLETPESDLRVIHDHLNENGVLILTTGDWKSLYARLAGKRWRLMTPPQHLFYFSPRSISTLLNRVGFEVLAIDRPWKMVPVGLMLYQLMRRTGVNIALSTLFDRAALPMNLYDAIRVVAKKR